MRALFTRLRRFLRSPRTITVELVGVGTLSALTAAVPQQGSSSAGSFPVFEHPTLARLIQLLGLDRILHGIPFLALLLLSMGSLLLVVVELARRAIRELPVPEPEAVLRRAQFRESFAIGESAAKPRVEMSGRFGALGLPVFHLGLLALMAAGALRALYGAEAGDRFYEGERIDPATSFSQQSQGALARPFRLSEPLTLGSFRVERHPKGGLSAISTPVAPASAGAERRLAINDPLRVEDAVLYVVPRIGLAAFVVFTPAQGPERREVAFLVPAGAHLEADMPLGGEAALRLSALAGERSLLPDSLELRLIRGGVLAYAGVFSPGDSVALPDGGRLALADLRQWIDIEAHRDPSVGLAMAGLALVILGIAGTFLVTRVERAVLVEKTAQGHRVTVALRAQRFAPLYEEAFKAFLARVRAEMAAGAEVADR